MLVLIRGAGDMATGVALRLWRAGIRVVLTDLPHPTAIRRTVCFSEAIPLGETAVEDVRARIEEQYPLAVQDFDEALAETGVAPDDRVTVSPARMRRMESRSFKTESGIEIKIPAELCNSDDAVEFIHSAGGGLSLLIKDVLV